MSELTAKQKAFIEELPKNQWNGTQAAIAAGYSPKSAGVMACRLMKNPAIIKVLDTRTAEIVEKTDIEIEEIIRELRKIAFGGKKATNTEILRALELLGRYKAMFTDRQPTDVNKMFLMLGAPKHVESKVISAIEGEKAEGG
jgi:phage terminase small subunit